MSKEIVLPCLNCCRPKCPLDPDHPPCQNISPELIALAVNRRLAIAPDFVSVVIPVYKPKPERLTKCLEHVVPQVDEVVVAGGIQTPWPLRHVPTDSRIRYIQNPSNNFGFGHTCNFGARHTLGNYILFLNDDCYLQPDCVSKLKAEMRDGVAMVSHLLLYPTGRVQYGGKFRPPGAAGFGHLDLNARRCRFTEPVEQESVCGASMLVRRKVFFDVDSFDNRFALYSEDDDLGLKVRKAGWKIIFHPGAVGIHEEHQSSSLRPDKMKLMQRSNELFAAKWHEYFEKGTF